MSNIKRPMSHVKLYLARSLPLRCTTVRIQKPSRSTKDVVEHRFGQLARLCVLLAGMIGGDYAHPIFQDTHAAMTEVRDGQRVLPTQFLASSEVSLECDHPQRDNDANPLERLEFLEKIGPAVGELFR